MKLLLSLVLASLVAFPAAPGGNEKFIEGTWRMTGSNGGHGWYLEWTFGGGKFNLDGYPPLHQQGKYRVLKEEGSSLTLELYEQSGNFGTENEQLEIVVDQDKDTLKIRNQGPFKRAAKS